MPSSSRAGPLTTRAGTTEAVVVFTPGRSKEGSAIAETAAHSSGMDSGGAPAMTAFTASNSTVQNAPLGYSAPSAKSAARPLAVTNSRTRSSVGCRTGRPSDQPRLKASAVNSRVSAGTSRRGAGAAVTLAHRPKSLEQRSIVFASDFAHLALGSSLQRVREELQAEIGIAALAGQHPDQWLEVLGADGHRRDIPLQGTDRVMHRPYGAGATVTQAHHGDVYLLEEFLVFLTADDHFLIALADGRPPDDWLSPVLFKQPGPLVGHIIPGYPEIVAAKPDYLALDGTRGPAQWDSLVIKARDWCQNECHRVNSPPQFVRMITIMRQLTGRVKAARTAHMLSQRWLSSRSSVDVGLRIAKRVIAFEAAALHHVGDHRLHHRSRHETFRASTVSG